MMPVWLFKEGEFYRVLDDHGLRYPAPVVLFKPREWRGATSNTSKQNLFAPVFAKEINEYSLCLPTSWAWAGSGLDLDLPA